MKVSLRLRPRTMEGRLVTWIVACRLAGFGVGTAAALIAWGALFFRKGAAIVLRFMVVRVACFYLFGV